MTWSTAVVTREKLYEEVWAEPVIKVAKRYGVSDVALRKVCIKLKVPMPPAGCWAKLAHGKPTSKPALPPNEGVQQHVFQRWVERVDEELQARLAAARAARADVFDAGAQTEVVVQTNRAEWHRTIKRTAAAVRSEFPRLVDSWRVAKGPGLFGLHTTKAGVERALSLLDLVVRLCAAAGFDVAAEATDGQPARVLFESSDYSFRVSEKSVAEERELTSKERDILVRDSRAYIPNRITRRGIGLLRIEVLNRAGWPVLTRNDTRHQRLEDVLHDIPVTLRDRALEESVRRALDKERAERAEVERQRRRALIAVKNEQLRRLQEVEKQAEQWLRSRRLHRYSRALQLVARLDETSAEDRERLLADAQWTERAAAWLNPLESVRWPEVDDASASEY